MNLLNEPLINKIIVEIDRDLEDLIPGYLSNRQKDTENISEALLKEDYESIRVIGHSMKGSGGGYGFSRITEIGKEIEISAIGKSNEKIREHVAKLHAYMHAIEIQYIEL